MPRTFSFGADPELIFVGIDSRGNPHALHAARGVIGGITNHSPTEMDVIGRNGHDSTAEMRLTPKSTLDELTEKILWVINQGALALTRLDARIGPFVGANGSPYPSQSFVRVAMMFGANPCDEATGGHLHVTTTDLNWYYTKEALQVLPFFCSLATFLYDKDHATHHGRRTRYSNYGEHGDMHPSPDHQGREVIVPDAQTSRREPIRVRAWGGREKGWELRTPSTWIAPQATAYRQKLFKCITNVIYSEDDEKEKQYKFLKKVCENLGGTIYKEVATTSLREYNQYFTDIKDEGGTEWIGAGGRGEHDWLNSYFMTRPDENTEVNFGKLLQACLDAQSEIHLTGFDDIFADMHPDRPYANDLNPFVFYPTTTTTPITPRLVQFNTVSEAITALKSSYRAFVESTYKADWISNGKAWFKIFPVQYVYTGGHREGVARDLYVPDMTYIAYGLCVDAVQRRALHVKFLPRKTEIKFIYGGGETGGFSGRPPEVAILAPPDFANNPDIRNMMAEEHYVIGEHDSNFWMRLNFRESSSDLRYISLALYILWMQNYIKPEGQTMKTQEINVSEVYSTYTPSPPTEQE